MKADEMKIFLRTDGSLRNDPGPPLDRLYEPSVRRRKSSNSPGAAIRHAVRPTTSDVLTPNIVPRGPMTNAAMLRSWRTEALWLILSSRKSEEANGFYSAAFSRGVSSPQVTQPGRARRAKSSSRDSNGK